MNHEQSSDDDSTGADAPIDQACASHGVARSTTAATPAARAAGPKGAAERERVGHVTIYRDPAISPNWNHQYSVDGKQVRLSLKTSSKSKARKLARKKDAQIELKQAEAPDARPVTIATAAKDYLASLKTRGRSQGTLVGYNAKLKAFEMFCSGERLRYLRQVTAAQLEAYQAALQETGVVLPAGEPAKPRGRGGRYKAGANLPRTVRDKMKVVRQLMKWARKRNLLQSDPGAGYELPVAVKTLAHCWTPAELNAVLDHAPAGFADLFNFLRMTGLRVDELCWLTQADLALDPPRVKIRAKTCSLSGQKWRPKHGNERIVPLGPEAATIATRAAAASPGPWLFYAERTNGKQKGLWRKHRIWLAVKAAMRAGKVTKGTTHTFRHVYCSFLVRQNVQTFRIMELMGHSSLEIVRQYCHTTEQDLLDAIGTVCFAAMLAPPSGAIVSSRETTGGGEKPAEN
ncbi:MAG: phage integrase family site specific recombinase [Phycisphaerales bacterium]|nr:phage integrase family site specific recombinase [Phycisphaerales bacterium]